MPKAPEELRLGSKASVSALAAEIAILEMEQDQRKTGDKEDSLEWAEDLEGMGK